MLYDFFWVITQKKAYNNSRMAEELLASQRLLHGEVVNFVAGKG